MNTTVGIDERGHELRFPPRYIYIKETLCTEQIGTRSPEQIQHARQTEVQLHRFTLLDRLLLQRAELCPDAAQLRIDLPAAGRAAREASATPMSCLKTAGWPRRNVSPMSPVRFVTHVPGCTKSESTIRVTN